MKKNSFDCFSGHAERGRGDKAICWQFSIRTRPSLESRRLHSRFDESVDKDPAAFNRQIELLRLGSATLEKAHNQNIFELHE
ncbi:MAG: hypothetical protein WBX18_11100 [Terracidiphilus sp.]